MALLEFKNISKIYKTGTVAVNALLDINLLVEKGSFSAIMGPSGSGKSTLMNLLGCLDVPTSGQYFLDGIEVSRLNDDELSEIRNRKIGFVFQSFNLIPRISVLENVELPLHYSGDADPKGKAIKALAMVGLEHRARHNPNELSGGETQRVAIARAIINSPSIILADEPTGNLDSKTGQQIMDIFKGLNKDEGATIIIVTHEIDVGKQTGKIITIRDGRIAEQ